MLKAIYEDIIQCINGCSLPCFAACVACTAFGERMLHFADSKLYRKIYHLGTLVYVRKKTRTSKGI